MIKYGILSAATMVGHNQPAFRNTINRNTIVDNHRFPQRGQQIFHIQFILEENTNPTALALRAGAVVRSPFAGSHVCKTIRNSEPLHPTPRSLVRAS